VKNSANYVAVRLSVGDVLVLSRDDSQYIILMQSGQNWLADHGSVAFVIQTASVNHSSTCLLHD